ncbi:MAG: hypothetical protein ONB46_16740 [candidate division KSB1 bacterium]|nr:hypothetical protein [candidate division KSB1 bacterium]MDZ7367361.1 hypothetical protein [candidate division KSB1 bacterium]MDZ7405242.1 hypothetical protein [candidate division KSB1 bacterium]
MIQRLRKLLIKFLAWLLGNKTELPPTSQQASQPASLPQPVPVAKILGRNSESNYSARSIFKK